MIKKIMLGISAVVALAGLVMAGSDVYPISKQAILNSTGVLVFGFGFLSINFLSKNQ